MDGRVKPGHDETGVGWGKVVDQRATDIDTERPSSRNRAPARTAGEQLSLRLWLHLIKCSRAVEAMIGSNLRRTHGQSLTRFDVLSQLDRLDEKWTTVGELARMMMVSSGNITALLDRMAEEGLVERRASPSDRRSQQVHMTRKGQKLFDSMVRDHARWVDGALHDLPRRDKERLIELLVAVRRAVEPPDVDDGGK
jgi:DNA-binding MarR family transcriptional regulator